MDGCAINSNNEKTKKKNTNCKMILDYHADYSNSAHGWLSLNILHKIIKGGYFILLLFVNIFGFVGCFVALSKKIFLPMIPLAFIFTLTIIFGYVEQRYLVPAYSFLIIFTAFILEARTGIEPI